MIRGLQKITRLFKSKSNAAPTYADFIKLLSLNHNVCTKEVLAHFSSEDLRIAIHSMRDHLKFLNQDVYESIVNNVESVKRCVDKALAGCSETDREIFYHCFGLRNKPTQPHSAVASMLGVSSSTVSRTSRRISNSIREQLNASLFPNVSLPETLPDISQYGAPKTLMKQGFADPSYSEFMLFHNEHNNSRSRHAYSIIKSPGLRAAVSSFHKRPTLLTEGVYNQLKDMKAELAACIIEVLKEKFPIQDVKWYAAYWLSDSGISPESLAAYHKCSVSKIRNHIGKAEEHVNHYILDLLQIPSEVVNTPDCVTRPIDPDKEIALLNKLIDIFKINVTADAIKESPRSLECFGNVFADCPLPNAVTARSMMNGHSIEQTKQILKTYGVDNDALTRSALRSRTYRFTKHLQNKYQVLRLSDGVATLYKKG